MISHGIHWTLIVELAPWMDGFYEGLEGITKELSGVICFTLIQLTIILTEVEAIVNSRPLVYVMNSNNITYGYSSEEKDEE